MTGGRAVRRSGGRYAPVLAALLVAATPLSAQTSIAERLRDRVPPEVVTAVEQLAARATAEGLPVEPLVQKAIEGGAKGVPGPRVVAALEALAARLESAARAVRSGGLAAPDAATVEAGEFALGTGIGEREIERLVRASGPPHPPHVSLRVAGALAALGVPAGQTVDLVVQVIEAGGSAEEILSLPAEVQAGMGRGLSAAEAAAGAARAVGRGARGHPNPPGRPPRRPPDRKPPHPPHPVRPPLGTGGGVT